MIYSKKELYSLLSDIENKVNDNIRRNIQENNINNNIINNTSENVKRNEEKNKVKKENGKRKNIEELKETFFTDNTIKESYNKIKNEIPIDTMFDFIDGTKVKLTHPYSFSKNRKQKQSEYEKNISTIEQNIPSHSNKQYQTDFFYSNLFKDQSNNQDLINNIDSKSREHMPLNNNSSVNKNVNINKTFTKLHHRNNQKLNDVDDLKNKIDLSNFNNNVSKIKNTQKIENDDKKKNEKQELEKLQLKLKEFLFETKIFLMLTLFRFYNSLTLKTFFVPDEYWQSIEVAHNFVFKYGYLTWEWKEKIRSFSYPLLFTFPYMILKRFKLDNTDLLVSFLIYSLFVQKKKKNTIYFLNI